MAADHKLDHELHFTIAHLFFESYLSFLETLFFIIVFQNSILIEDYPNATTLSSANMLSRARS